MRWPVHFQPTKPSPSTVCSMFSVVISSQAILWPGVADQREHQRTRDADLAVGDVHLLERRARMQAERVAEHEAGHDRVRLAAQSFGTKSVFATARAIRPNVVHLSGEITPLYSGSGVAAFRCSKSCPGRCAPSRSRCSVVLTRILLVSVGIEAPQDTRPVRRRGPPAVETGGPSATLDQNSPSR
jgi:hypothetical protein